MSSDIKKIVWLASYPKSGNTWFRVFLSNLLAEEGQPVHINKLHSSTIASSRMLFDENAGVPSSDLTNDEIAELRPEIYRGIAETTDETIFHKVHDAWVKTPTGKPLFPSEITKAVIYFIRNPLDVAVSFAFHSQMKPDQMIQRINDPDYAFCNREDRIFNQFVQPLKDWSGHVQSWVVDSGLPLIVIKYEDMLENTFETFKFAVSFLGIEKDDDSLLKAIEASSIEKLKKMEEEAGFQEKPQGMKSFFREGKSGNWKKHLTQKQVAELINKHHDFMDRYGYLTDL